MVAVGEDRAALAHGDVMRWVKAECANVAKCAHMLAIDGRAQRVAAILDQDEAAAIADFLDRLDVEGVAERMRDHDRPGAWRDRILDGVDLDVVGGDIDVDENGRHVPHDRRIDRGGEARRAGDDLVAGLHLTSLLARRSQRGKGDQIRRRAGINRQGMTDANALGELAFEFRVETPRRQPEIKRRVDQHPHVAPVVNSARHRHGRRSRREGLWRMRQLMIAPDKIEDGRPQGFRVVKIFGAHDRGSRRRTAGTARFTGLYFRNKLVNDRLIFRPRGPAPVPYLDLRRACMC